jgi:hypothetical protein
MPSAGLGVKQAEMGDVFLPIVISAYQDDLELVAYDFTPEYSYLHLCLQSTSLQACRSNRYGGLAFKVIHDPGIMFTKSLGCSPVTFLADLGGSWMSHNHMEAVHHNLSLATNKSRELVSLSCGRK